MNSIQLFLTPAAGKALIAKGLVLRPDIQSALRERTVLVIGGTTNAYAANALLAAIGQPQDVVFPEFHRGVSLPPGAGMQAAEQRGDLIIEKGVPRFENNLPEICSRLREGDIILKGANAVHPATHTAAILIGNTETGGTIAEASKAVYSHRAKLILPVGLEKRVDNLPAALEALVNEPGAMGLRLTAAPGEAFTELDAIRLLTGSEAVLIAAGGVNGGEGGIYLQAAGGDLELLRELVREVNHEAPVVV